MGTHIALFWVPQIIFQDTFAIVRKSQANTGSLWAKALFVDENYLHKNPTRG